MRYKDIWPIDEKAATPPEGWSGWPGDKKFALVLTHDVETVEGLNKCKALMDLEISMGFRSCFNFVPYRYGDSSHVRQELTNNGFEVGVHGLYHDGKLFSSRKIFRERTDKINAFLKEWNAKGFYSPSMHHNLEWTLDLEIDYDSSTFDTDPFEPQPGGVSTIYPFHVSGNSNQKGYVELPYTLPQDFTLFVILGEKNIDIWKRKLNWIVENGGMAMLNTHPDYMNFDGRPPEVDEYPIEHYEKFLEYIHLNYEGQFWHILPKEIAQFWIKHIDIAFDT